jgi:hypothetical protein
MIQARKKGRHHARRPLTFNVASDTNGTVACPRWSYGNFLRLLGCFCRPAAVTFGLPEAWGPCQRLARTLLAGRSPMGKGTSSSPWLLTPNCSQERSPSFVLAHSG